MGIKRRAFLIGGAAIVGGAVFGVEWLDGHNVRRAAELTAGKGETGFATWLKIGADDTVTLITPHIDFGQGSHTALAQMLAEELDADWAKMKVEQAPADVAFANTPLGEAFILGETQIPAFLTGLVKSGFSMIARSMPLQITGGSTAVRFTGQHGIRVAGAAVRMALVATAADKLGVPASELTTENARVVHAKSGKSLRYGEIAEAAASRSLTLTPALKQAKDFRVMGKPVARFDVPGKVDGSAKYGIDFTLPDMRVATLMMAPVRGGKLISVDPAPAMAVNGVEKVVKLDEAVVVVAKGYWPALKGLRALSPKFDDGGHGALSTATIFADQDKLRAAGKSDNNHGNGDPDAVFKQGGKTLDATYRVPFLHQAMMEPFVLTAHHKDGKLDIWGGMQDPLATRMIAAKISGLGAANVTFHPMIMGGGFGRRFPDYSQVIGQVTQLAMQLPYPVKLIWSREEDVKHGAYRPQSSAGVKASLGGDGKITAWRTDYVQFADAESETVFPYDVPAVARHHYKYISHQVDAYWRSVNSTQHGFYNESFMDELAHAAGIDPYEFRRRHLKPGGRHLAVLDAVAKKSGWGSPLSAGLGRGMALVESFGTIVGEVVEIAMQPDGTPKVTRVTAVADCGTVVSPKNAETQVQGGIIMGLSAALGEAITLEKGAVVQSSFPDYPVLQMAAAPAVIDVSFIDSGATIGGLGEPGLPPVAPALANAVFAATGKRVRQLPLLANLRA
ncbi:MAG: molybdopterin cofactor-binding domain-containing protein [Sphingomonas sp.]